MEDWNGHVINKRSGFGGRSATTTTRYDCHENFEEEDVWDIAVKESSHEDSSPTMKKLIPSSSGSSRIFPNTSSTPRNIPRRANTQTTTNDQAKVAVQVRQASAPMKIPDWSKIYGTSNANNINGHGYGDYHDHADCDDDGDGGGGGGGGGDDDDDDMVPPHEWIARKLARSKISSFSVCEGIGRTLKGRDLSKVRNAILTKTGFLE